MSQMLRSPEGLGDTCLPKCANSVGRNGNFITTGVLRLRWLVVYVLVFYVSVTYWDNTV